MAVAKTTQYWSSRMDGNDPTALVGNFQDNWTAAVGGGSQDLNQDWVVTNAKYTLTPIVSETKYTLVTCISYITAPDNNEVIMELDNGTHKVQVQSTGTNTSLKLVGATTVTIIDLDLILAESKPVPLILRLTLDSNGNAKLYTHEIIQNDDATNVFYSVTGATGSSRLIRWGNTNGSVKWSTVYYSKFGAFNPEELMTSGFAQDAIPRMGISIVDLLKNTTRMYLRTQVPDSNIMYGYDISSEMINRYTVPNIHVLVPTINSPEFIALAGAKTSQNYDVEVYVTTRGTNYENAYRQGLNILGEVFDELYTQTGVTGTTDSLISFNATFDTKMDDDETVCVHQLTLTYMRRIDMRHR